ncbi:MAG: RDD family protein [Nanoarchaeota archaeon]
MKDFYKFGASIPRRALAFLADLIVMNLVLFTPFEGILGHYMKGSWEESLKWTQIPSGLVVVMVCMVVLALLYFSLLEFFLHQTIGMMLLGLYVEGSVSFWRALIRNVFIIPFFPFFLLWVVEPLYLFFKGERWLERLTSTRTVEFAEYSP